VIVLEKILERSVNDDKGAEWAKQHWGLAGDTSGRVATHAGAAVNGSLVWLWERYGEWDGRTHCWKVSLWKRSNGNATVPFAVPEGLMNETLAGR
jgi:hypothetical protein